jgi:hypothetical protein
MKRRTRFAAALVAIAAILFAPFAMALNACADNGDMAAPMAGMAPMASMAGDDAPAMDMALCERHCHDGKVSFQPAGHLPAPLAVPAPPALRVQVAQPVALRAPSFDSPYAPAAGPAPPLIGYTVLRI